MLSDDLADLQQSMSRFRKVAQHVHSPASYDWGQGSNDPQDDRHRLLANPQPYLDCLDATYDLVAITDHMEVRFACEHRAQTKRCHVLPGMEISVCLQPPWNPARLHFLVLFPEAYAVDQAERIFLLGKKVPGADARSGKEIAEYRDLEELAKQVHAAGGLLIAAHIDSDGGGGYRAAFRAEAAGVLQLVCEDRDLDTEAKKVCEGFKEHLAQAKIDAVEVHKASDAKHYRFTLGSGSVEVPTLSRNDAHTMRQLAGGQCTYVKMTGLSFDGLRRALRFPDTRIRHSPPPSQTCWIEGIRIRSGAGVLAGVTLGFSPNLSCVIGARGAGKSSVVDALRYVFGYNRNMGEGIGEDLNQQVRKRQQATLGGATIEICYATHSAERYILVCDYQPGRDYATTVRDESGRDVPVTDVEKDGRFPCRLFGWSEIERLGREPSQQRALLDRILDLHAQIAERESILAELREERKRIEAHALEVDRLFNQTKELKKRKEYEQNLALLQQPEVEEMFKVLDAANENHQAARRWQSEVDRWAKELGKALSVPRGSLPVSIAQAWKEIGGPELIADADHASTALGTAVKKLASAAAELVRLTADARNAAQTDLENKLVGRTDITDLARRRTGMKQQLALATEEAESYERELTKLGDELARRRERVDKLRSTLGELTQARSAGVASVGGMLAGAGGPAIGIRLGPEADDSAYREWIKGYLAAVKPWQKRDRIIEALSNKLRWADTCRTLVDQHLAIQLLGLKEDDVPVAEEKLQPFMIEAGSGCVQVRPAVLSAILEADEHPADDVLEVTLAGAAIGSLSPGQRCSALLPIILLGSTSPLVIDQPEDNLDNQLITELLIHTLHELKERRQVIVVTHNANIVVTGDAEQVVVMESKGGKCLVRRQASIDDPKVMRDVVELMEGGEEALRRRFKRYWPDGEMPPAVLLAAQ